MRLRLRETRIKQGFTHKTLAEQLGISRSTFTNIELGYKNPSFDLAIKIKQVLHYANDDIFLNLECRKGTKINSIHQTTA